MWHRTGFFSRNDPQSPLYVDAGFGKSARMRECKKEEESRGRERESERSREGV